MNLKEAINEKLTHIDDQMDIREKDGESQRKAKVLT